MQYFLPDKISLRRKSGSVVLSLILLIAMQTSSYAANAFNSFSGIKLNRYTAAVPIKGKVIDKTTGETIIGASVKIKGTSTGTVTDVNGSFALNADPNAVLIVSYIGYEQAEFPLNGQTSVTIRLQVNAKNLNEVIVVGYGTQKKTSSTPQPYQPFKLPKLQRNRWLT